METIYTKYSPGDKVIWKRVEKSIEKNSEHTIRSIRTETKKVYRHYTIDSTKLYCKGLWFSFLSVLNNRNHRKGSDYGKMANHCFDSVRKGKELKPKSIKTDILYYLDTIGTPVLEIELFEIEIWKPKPELTNNKVYEYER